MLWICLACTTPYSVDAPCCPHCGSTAHRLFTDPVDGEGTPVQPDTPKGKPGGGDA